ncbi:MAG TPA: hypothetical protein PLF40_10800 [Kofleriaceae bacterium]|nr:hypothetical protein [Kofleriaceae bacterium]
MAKPQAALAAMIVSATPLGIGSNALAGGTAAAPPAASACIPRDAAFNVAKLDGALTLCTIEKACWRVDVAADKWQPSPTTLPDPEPAVDAVEVTAQGFKICNPATKACETIALPKVETDDLGSTRAVVNEDQSLLAVFTGQEALRVFDLKTRKQLYTVKPTKSAMNFIGAARFIGPALYVMSSHSPVSSSGKLVNARTGKLITDIGKKGGPVDELMPLALGGDRYAFATWMLDKLLIINVKTGKVLKKVALGGNPKMPLEGLTLLALTPDNKIVAVADSIGIALVQVIDPVTGARTVLKAPGC